MAVVAFYKKYGAILKVLAIECSWDYFLNIITGIDMFRIPFVLMICYPKETNNFLYNFLCY